MSPRNETSLVRRTLAVGQIVVFLIFMLPHAMMYGQGANLFEIIPEGQFLAPSPAQEIRLQNLTQRETTASIDLGRPNVSALGAASTQITIPGVGTLTVVGKIVEAKNPDEFTWIGALPTDPGAVTLVVRGGDVTGTIRAPDGNIYRVEPIGGGIHAIVKVTPSRFPPDHPPDFKAVEAASLSDNLTVPGGERILAEGPVGIDVMVAYTAAARSSVANITALIDVAVAEANQSYQNSGINIRLNLVDRLEVNYSESAKTYEAIVLDLSTRMPGIHARRDSSGADVVVLLVNNTSSCGRGSRIGADATTAFAAVHYDCATGNYSLAHEIGHLQGARHDPEFDPATQPRPYAHGFRHDTPPAWRTIMAYPCPGPELCPRLQYWSNPLVSYGDITMGTPELSDNARVLNETSSALAAFRPPPPGASVPGLIWRYTGTPCTGASCPGWQLLDNNPASQRITPAAGGNLYQLHNSGRIWRFTGTPCTDNSCPGWQLLDNNAATISITAVGNDLYQLHNSGRIWRFTGVACSGESCPGWQLIDNNPATLTITAAGGQLYQLHNSGRIWRFTGMPCNGEVCPGWQMLDNNPATVAITAADQLYQLHDSGRIWRFTGVPCSGESCPGWEMLDNNGATASIAAGGGMLYQLHTTGQVWRYTGTPCSGESCPGWQLLDNNVLTKEISAAGNELYQLHVTGQIWRYTGTPCNGDICSGWQMLDNNPATGKIAPDEGSLYQIHLIRTLHARDRVCEECRPH